MATTHLRVFIGWSGSASRRFGELLHEWLPRFLPGTEPWISNRDISDGTEWNAELTRSLHGCHVYIACITAENVKSEWIHFEAGVVAREIEEPTLVCPFLLDVAKRDLRGPLALLQATSLNASDTQRLMRTLNRKAREIGAAWLADTTFDTEFDKRWPFLEEYKFDTLGELMKQRDAKRIPFLLAQVPIIWQARATTGRSQSGIPPVRELRDQINPLKSESVYLAKAIELVKTNSVWAICGRKNKEAGWSFYEANRKSPSVRRLFFPPLPGADKENLYDVIEFHLAHGMGVQVFKEGSDRTMQRQRDLPPGFGMTLMGKDRVGREPSLVAVLIHWGDLDYADQHWGVILKEEAWTAHFWTFYNEIQPFTDTVKPGKTMKQFVDEYRHYDLQEVHADKATRRG